MLKPRKVFSLVWVFESFQDDPSFFSRRMFGGLSVYLHGRMIMVLAENSDDSVWNGILYPTEREHHASLKKDFPSLENHSILPKWLYLPMSASDFETVATETAQLIAGNDPRFGILPKTKKRGKKKK